MTTFIDNCANGLLGAAGSCSLGLLFGHACRKVVPSKKGFDATATALWGGTLYLLDTVGKKVFDCVFKNFGNSTKTLASGIRLALEAGLAYKLTEIVAKQLEAPFETTPYDTNFFLTSAAIGVAGMGLYTTISEKTQKEGILVTATDKIIGKIISSFQRDVKSNQPPFSEGMSLKEFEAYIAFPQQHYLMGSAVKTLKVMRGAAEEFFLATPSSMPFMKKLDHLCDSFVRYLKIQGCVIDNKDWKTLTTIKNKLLIQINQIGDKATCKWVDQANLLSKKVKFIKETINFYFRVLHKILIVRQQLNEAGLTEKKDYVVLLHYCWLFLEARMTFAELERSFVIFLEKFDENEQLSVCFERLLEDFRLLRQAYCWKRNINPPSDQNVSMAYQDFLILREQLRFYFPDKNNNNIPVSKEEIMFICQNLMDCGVIVMKGLIEDLKISASDPQKRTELLMQFPEESANVKSSPYFHQAFFALAQTYRMIVNLDKSPANSHGRLLGNNWQKEFFKEGTPQNEWRTIYNDAYRIIGELINNQWNDERFSSWAAPHQKGEEAFLKEPCSCPL